MHTENRDCFQGHRRFYEQAYRLLRSIGQSFSALSASSLEYVSAVSSSHSLSEAVLFFSLTLFGLIGSEHCVAPPYICWYSGSRDIRKYSGSVLLFSRKYALYNDILY